MHTGITIIYCTVYAYDGTVFRTCVFLQPRLILLRHQTSSPGRRQRKECLNFIMATTVYRLELEEKPWTPDPSVMARLWSFEVMPECRNASATTYASCTGRTKNQGRVNKLMLDLISCLPRIKSKANFIYPVIWSEVHLITAIGFHHHHGRKIKDSKGHRRAHTKTMRWNRAKICIVPDWNLSPLDQ